MALYKNPYLLYQNDRNALIIKLLSVPLTNLKFNFKSVKGTDNHLGINDIEPCKAEI